MMRQLLKEKVRSGMEYIIQDKVRDAIHTIVILAEVTRIKPEECHGDPALTESSQRQHEALEIIGEWLHYHSN